MNLKQESPVGEWAWQETPEGISARGRLPKRALFFEDHFPKFPVLPGVLALEILRKIVEEFLNRVSSPYALKRGSSTKSFEDDIKSIWRLQKLDRVRFSAYLKPSMEWEARLECLENGENASRWKAKIFAEARVAAQAQFVLTREEKSAYGR